MRKEIFVTDAETMEEMEIKYNLEDCGMSGLHYQYHWFSDDEADVDVYFKLEDKTKIKEDNMYTVEFGIVGEDWEVISTFETLEDANKEMEHQIKMATDTENDEGDRLAIFCEGEMIEEFVFDGNVYI